MNKKNIFIFSIIFGFLFLIFKFNIIEITSVSIVIDFNNILDLIGSISSIPSNIFNSITNGTVSLIDIIFQPEILGLIFFFIVVMAFASSN
jgi:hypothetical protein